MTARRAGKLKQVFVTGFPNFVAVKLVQALAEQSPDVRLHVLIREKHHDMAEKLLKRLRPAARRRVTVYTGNITHLDLGLSGEEINSLSDTITHVYHLGAVWEYGLPRGQYESVTVQGARNLLAFAKECRALSRLFFFSSIHVSGRRRGVIMEEEFEHRAGFKNQMEACHYEAERDARKALAAGLPVTIFRLGNIVGDSATGEIMAFQGAYRFVEILLTLDRNLPLFIPGPCEGPINLTPVDYVVSATLLLGGRDEPPGQVYHLTDPFPLAARSVLESLCHYLGRKPPTFGLPRSLYRAVFLIPGMDRASGIPRELYDMFNHKAVHNCSRTLEALKGTGLACPRFETYFPIGIEYARQLLRRRAERREEEQTIDPLDLSGA